jgi:hypothetical protein
MNENDKLIEAQFNRLPPQLQAAIKAVQWKDLVKEIALANKLTPEQAESLERETMFIIYGFENPEDYPANLMREMQIGEEAIIAIVEAVNEKILKVIAQKAEGEGVSKPVEAHASLPMVEPGEVAHDVPHVEQPLNAPVSSAPAAPPLSPPPEVTKAEPSKPAFVPPKSHYSSGQDPYREPLV